MVISFGSSAEPIGAGSTYLRVVMSVDLIVSMAISLPSGSHDDTYLSLR